MKLSLRLHVALALLSPLSQSLAQEPEPLTGHPQIQTAATPGIFQDEQAGLTLRLPGGFGFLIRQGTLTVFGSKITPGIVLLETGETFTEAEIASAAENGYRNEGVALRPVGVARLLVLTSAQGIAIPVEGTLETQAVRGLLTGIRGPDGRCFLILAATTHEAWPRLAPVAEQLVAGIALTAPKPPAIDPQWRTYFGGTRLSYYFSRSSYSSTGTNQGSLQSTERIYLCSDGTFHFGEQTRASFDLPQAMGYSRTGDSSAGRWSALGQSGGAQLTLAFHDGRLWRYQATRLGKEVLYLNGSKYFRSGQSRCR